MPMPSKWETIKEKVKTKILGSVAGRILYCDGICTLISGQLIL